MRHAIGTTILAAVAAASASACALSPFHQECSTTETVRDDTKEIETRRACDDLERTSGNGLIDCASTCGAGYNECFHASDYPSAWNEANASRTAPEAPFACPPPRDGRAVVTIRCQETRPDTEYTAGGCSVEGRRPERLLAAPRARGVTAVGAYFANVAHLEAAAVLAFEHMLVELRAHGAPRALVEAADRARRDELRHTRVTAALARRFGAFAPPAEAAPTPVRDLFSIALENEVEGVVRETLGAAIATWRADHAGDAHVAARMLEIAADERAHAELSFSLTTWLRGRLSPAKQRRLDEARRMAIAELHATFGEDPAPAVVAIAGAPRARDVAAMLGALEELWSFRRAA